MPERVRLSPVNVCTLATARLVVALYSCFVVVSGILGVCERWLVLVRSYFCTIATHHWYMLHVTSCKRKKNIHWRNLDRFVLARRIHNGERARMQDLKSMPHWRFFENCMQLIKLVIQSIANGYTQYNSVTSGQLQTPANSSISVTGYEWFVSRPLPHKAIIAASIVPSARN